MQTQLVIIKLTSSWCLTCSAVVSFSLTYQHLIVTDWAVLSQLFETCENSGLLSPPTLHHAALIYYCKAKMQWNRSINHLLSWIRPISTHLTWCTFNLKTVCTVLLQFPGWMTCLCETVCNMLWGLFSLVWWLCQRCLNGLPSCFYTLWPH